MEYLSTIELAMKNEDAEMNFYLGESKRSRNPLARAMFEQLAREEGEHKARVSDLHQRLTREGRWPERVPLKVGNTSVTELLRSLAGKKKSTAHDDDDLQALEKAIRFESEAAQRYEALAQESQQTPVKNFFAELAAIEREHQRSLAGSLAYLRDPAGWSMEKEKAGLDGA